MQSFRQIMADSPLPTYYGNPAKQVLTSASMSPSHPSQETSSPLIKDVSIDKRIDRLFLRLGAIYGHIWFSTYKNEYLLKITKEEWTDALQPFDTSILKDALLRIREHNPYPPTLPQFIECCKALRNRHQPYLPKTKDVHQPPDHAAVLAHLEALLKKVRSPH